jgi:hypothetical protein
MNLDNWGISRGCGTRGTEKSRQARKAAAKPKAPTRYGERRRLASLDASALVQAWGGKPA